MGGGVWRQNGVEQGVAKLQDSMLDKWFDKLVRAVPYGLALHLSFCAMLRIRP
jgi:hypothetical protein